MVHKSPLLNVISTHSTIGEKDLRKDEYNIIIAFRMLFGTH